MSSIHELPRRAYVNVMELLVSEEVDKQLAALPPRVLKYVKRLEVETYALNRLPALYASSEKGWQYQYEKAKREMRHEINDAVRRALAAVQVDPLRTSQPLNIVSDDEAQVALKTLREMLQQPDLSWDGLIKRLSPLVGKGTPKPADFPPPLPNPGVSGSHRPEDPANRRHWRPGTYGAEVSWKHRYQGGAKRDFDWNDARYQK